MDETPTLAEIWQEVQALKQNSGLIDHFHNGFDSSRVSFNDVYLKKLWYAFTIYGADAATSANYKTFLIVPVASTLTGFKEVHGTAGTDGGAVTIDLEKLTGTTAPGSGSTMLSATLNLKGAANTILTATLTGTLANRSVKIGDRIALKSSGTLTSVADVSVLVELTVV
jgi:hypothetical protein